MLKLLPIACTFFLLRSVVLLSATTEITSNPKRPANHTYQRAGVVTNTETCTNIALDILGDDGSAVDAAIAALLCEGITNPQSMGLGGGFLMTIYDSASRSAHVLNAREVAPASACSKLYSRERSGEISVGALAAAVPGEVMGYYEAHKKFGKIGWYDLFRPAIDIASSGIPVTQYTADMIAKVRDDIASSPTMTALLTNPETNHLYKAGETMQRKTLANTLELIAQHGPKALYNGILTEDFLLDIHENGGIITSEDLKDYKAVWGKPVEHSIGKYTLYSAGNPGSGELLMYTLDVMSRQLCNVDALFWHRMIETWKYMFGLRAAYSGGGPDSQSAAQSKFNASLIEAVVSRMKDTCTSNNANDYFLEKTHQTPAEDHGTSQICVYAPNGDAVSVTSTINLSFGALFASESTGIILNNEMMDFAIPRHFRGIDNTPNRIVPGHYPMSTMVPTIVLNSKTGKVRLVIGAAGGFKILTSTSFVVLQNLFMSIPLKRAVPAKRLHHQLKPMVVEYEEGFDEAILMDLQKFGHILQLLENLDTGNSTSNMSMYSCVNGISIVNNGIHPVGDPRRKAYGAGL